MCLNVGFLLHQTLGYSRTFDFEVPHVQVGDDLDVSDLHGELRLSRTAQGLYAAGALRASTLVDCVRCLTPFDQPLTVVFDDLFVYPPSRANEPLLAIPETGLLDLTPLAREYFLLDMPLRPLCRPECRGLCPECGADWNNTECEHVSSAVDPRLQGLRALLDDSA